MFSITLSCLATYMASLQTTKSLPCLCDDLARAARMFSHPMLILFRYASFLLGISSVTIFVTLYHPLHLPLPTLGTNTNKDNVPGATNDSITTEQGTKALHQVEKMHPCCQTARACCRTCTHTATKITHTAQWLRMTWADVFGVHGKYQWSYMLVQEFVECVVQTR